MADGTWSQAVTRIADRTASQHLWGSRDVIGHVTICTPYVISYWWSFGTESLYPAVFEILCSKRLGVTSFTFHGYVTSSVTWLFDSPYAVSCWWSFGTKPLSVTVSEIFNVKCNAMVDVTLIRPLNKGQGHSFWYQSISHRLSIVTSTVGCTI